ncbi:MAG: hypothetical protein ACLUHC_03670 [Clostridia bacterium]
MANIAAQSKTSERMEQMKQGFLELRNAGKLFSEIAEVFGVSVWSIYDNLQEIADANGLSREDLLYRIHKPHVMSSTSQKVKNVDKHLTVEELQKNFSDMLSITNYIISNIDKALQSEKDNKEDFENE